jgi:hypothetical protein
MTVSGLTIARAERYSSHMRERPIHNRRSELLNWAFLRRALKNSNLMPKGNVLQLQSGAAFQK